MGPVTYLFYDSFFEVPGGGHNIKTNRDRKRLLEQEDEKSTQRLVS